MTNTELIRQEIERRLKSAESCPFIEAEFGAEMRRKGKIQTYNEILSLIDSLQQEQPKFKVGDTIHKIGENTVFPMTIERIYDGDYVCVTEHQQSFINIKFQDDYELVEQEQPEVDLEKELDRYLRGEFQQTAGGNFNNYIQVARHFYELGINARKEE